MTGCRFGRNVSCTHAIQISSLTISLHHRHNHHCSYNLVHTHGIARPVFKPVASTAFRSESIWL